MAEDQKNQDVEDKKREAGLALAAGYSCLHARVAYANLLCTAYRSGSTLIEYSKVIGALTLAQRAMGDIEILEDAFGKTVAPRKEG